MRYQLKAETKQGAVVLVRDYNETQARAPFTAENIAARELPTNRGEFGCQVNIGGSIIHRLRIG